MSDTSKKNVLKIIAIILSLSIIIALGAFLLYRFLMNPQMPALSSQTAVRVNHESSSSSENSKASDSEGRTKNESQTPAPITTPVPASAESATPSPAVSAAPAVQTETTVSAPSVTVPAVQAEDNSYLYRQKAESLKSSILTLMDEGTAIKTPGGYVVFISVSDGTQRAYVSQGNGNTLSEAWDAAESTVKQYVEKNDIYPAYLKADVVNSYNEIYPAELYELLAQSGQDCFRMGISFDTKFKNAVMEEELNCYMIIDYEKASLDFYNLHEYLFACDRNFKIEKLKNKVCVFECTGFICDETSKSYRLIDDGLSYGRRDIQYLDKAYAQNLVTSSASFIIDNIKEDGSFLYGVYPRFDAEMDGYNYLTHAGALWSLILEYRISQDQTLIPKIENAFDYIINNAVIAKDSDTSYVTEPEDREIKLGGNALLTIAISEYFDATGSDKYNSLALKLGSGILSMSNKADGSFVHVLDADNFSIKARFITSYYDGEAAFALCKLYGMTMDQKWLTAAKTAVDFFVSDDYTPYRDHWVSYALNEITKHYPEERYFDFALKNAAVNIDYIAKSKTTDHVYLELLMNAFETYDRMLKAGIDTPYSKTFPIQKLLDTIAIRADRMLDGYLYPEYAMYMENPASVVNTFMYRNDGFRVRIDDIQHNIFAYYLYYKNYDLMVKDGLK